MNPLGELRWFFSEMPDLSFAVLEGSHADGAAQARRDWDIAVQWQASVDWLAVIGAHDGKVLIGKALSTGCIS